MSRNPLSGYFKILQRIKDATIGVANGYRTGLYIWGRHGTGKTWTARTILEEQDPEAVYLSGHIDPQDFFDTLEEYPNGHILLDDTSSLFSTRRASNWRRLRWASRGRARSGRSSEKGSV